jgi:hypothetical protein
MKRIGRIAAIGAALCFGQALYADGDRTKGDSGITGPPYREIVAMMDRLGDEYPEWITPVRYGKSVLGVDLVLVKLEAPAAMRKTPKGRARAAVLITGSTHGNEYLHIEDRLPEEFVSKRDSLPGLAKFLSLCGIVYLLPILNPDGYDRDERENINGFDLNRDFPLGKVEHEGFFQPETRVLGDYIKEEVSRNNMALKVALDYHCCAGALLYPWSYSAEPMPSQDLAAHQLIARKMVATLGNNYEYGTTGEILGYRPLGTSKDYYYFEYGTVSFTFEGQYRTEAENFPQHVKWWDQVFAMLTE